MNPLSAAANRLPHLASEPLAGLRDYHLPEPVSWWPLAPGWWLLLAAMAVVAVALWWWSYRRRCRRAAAHQALRELAQLRAAAAGRDDVTPQLRDLSKLLRRYAMAAFPGQAIAAMTGDEWLAFLDVHGGGGRFRHGPGRQLVEAPYRPGSQIPLGELSTLVQDWILSNREVCR